MVNFLDLYLAEIYKQFIVIKENEYRKSKRIFDGVFQEIKQEMKKQCKFFHKYSKQDMYAGSVYDHVKIGKMDEFDIDIVIKLPVNYEKIQIETDLPGFVKLKIPEFDLLPRQKNWEDCHKVTLEWRDDEKYLLQNKFRQWMHSIIQKSLNALHHRVTVENVLYTLKYKESGPAYTLNIKESGDDSFKLDVDLVPVIKFHTPRWPGENYRRISCPGVSDWLVVPKPNKLGTDETRNRTWRLSFQEFERCLMKRGQHLKPTLRLLKKLRGSLNMDEIASYYIKTLFLWKVHEVKEADFWRQNLSDLFRIMVKEFHHAISNKIIPYFWHEENNLIKNVDSAVLKIYAKKLKQVVDDTDLNKIHSIVSFLLTKDELVVFQNSEFYKKHNGTTFCTTPLASTSYFNPSTDDKNICLDNNKPLRPETSKSVENSNNTHEKREVENDTIENDDHIVENNKPGPSRSWSQTIKKAVYNAPILLMALYPSPSTDWKVNPDILQRENIAHEHVIRSREYDRFTLQEHYTENGNYVVQQNILSDRVIISNERDPISAEYRNDLSEDKHGSKDETSEFERKGERYEERYEVNDYHNLSDDDISW